MSRAAVISKIVLSLVAMTMYVAAQTNEGPRNFTGSNTTQIVNVNQSSRRHLWRGDRNQRLHQWCMGTLLQPQGCGRTWRSDGNCINWRHR